MNSISYQKQYLHISINFIAFLGLLIPICLYELNIMVYNCIKCILNLELILHTLSSTPCTIKYKQITSIIQDANKVSHGNSRILFWENYS